MKEYAIEQRRFNEKVFGRGTRNIDSVEGLMNSYAQKGWILHTMITTPTRDEKTQLTTMVFERDVPGTVPAQISVCPKCGNTLVPGTTFCGGCGFRIN